MFLENPIGLGKHVGTDHHIDRRHEHPTVRRRVFEGLEIGLDRLEGAFHSFQRDRVEVMSVGIVNFDLHRLAKALERILEPTGLEVETAEQDPVAGLAIELVDGGFEVPLRFDEVP